MMEMIYSNPVQIVYNYVASHIYVTCPSLDTKVSQLGYYVAIFGAT